MPEEKRRLHISFDASISPEVEAALSSYFEIVKSSAEADIQLTGGGQMQAKINAICDAGIELTQLDASQVKSLNVAQRLRLMEEKVVRYVHELLDMDNFEVRLLDRRTGNLELVIAENFSPLKIGETIKAEESGHGICGYVAATGQSYICDDVSNEPLYREGLDEAASSLTVPLWMNDKIIGVFNAESYQQGAFDDSDRRLVEIFGRYIASAMHTLDLLVIERYTTNEQISNIIAEELEDPIAELAELAKAVQQSDASTGGQLQRTIKDIQDRIAACTSGPQTIIDADRANFVEPDPAMKNKRILVADDEEAVRSGVHDVLTKLGCLVTVCEDGLSTIESIKLAHKDDSPFDLILSDIRMPGCNGYEVYQAATEIWPDQIVILMTGFGYDPHHSIMRASQEGMHAVIFKPFRTEQLIETIIKAVRKTADC
ncbi:MAG: response regulator [Planctomycetota bacterium]|nr:response regulator [Planctomycetota bacterium]